MPNRFCARCCLLAAREPHVLTLRAGARGKQQQADKRRVFIQQQRLYVGGSNTAFPKYRSKSRIWLYGAGVGIALAVGLKYGADAANSSCDDKVTVSQRTDGYSAAIKLSRDLVERIQVGIEVGPLKFCILTDQSPLIALSLHYLQWHLYHCLCLPVVRLRSGLQGWWLGSLWMVLRSGVKVGACPVHFKGDI